MCLLLVHPEMFKLLLIISKYTGYIIYIQDLVIENHVGGSCGRDHMVVGSTNTYAISAYLIA
jgi:hypothetical protein